MLNRVMFFVAVAVLGLVVSMPSKAEAQVGPPPPIAENWEFFTFTSTIDAIHTEECARYSGYMDNIDLAEWYLQNKLTGTGVTYGGITHVETFSSKSGTPTSPWYIETIFTLAVSYPHDLNPVPDYTTWDQYVAGPYDGGPVPTICLMQVVDRSRNRK